MVGRAWFVLQVAAILLSVPSPLASPKDLSHRRVINGETGTGASKGGAGAHRASGASGVGKRAALPGGAWKGSALRKPKGSKGAPAKEAKVTIKPPIPRPQGGKRPPGKSSGKWLGKGGKLPGMGARFPRGQSGKVSNFGNVKVGKVAPRWPKPIASKKSPFGRVFGMGANRKPRASAENRHRHKFAGKKAPTYGQSRFQAGKTPPRKPQQKFEMINRNIRAQKMKDYEQKQLLQFKLADADGDEKITADEALATNASLWARHGRNETLKDYEALLRVRMKREAWFETADTNKDGFLTFDEFKFRLKKPERPPPQNLQQRQEAQFKLIDADRDGKITVQEVLAAKLSLKIRKGKGKGLQVFETVLLRRMNEEGWMQAVDLDGDGMLVFDEFKLFKKLEPKPQEL